MEARGYQRVTHEDVVTPLDEHVLRYHSPRLNTPWQKIVQFHIGLQFSDQFIVAG
jgi:hypothetical protein